MPTLRRAALLLALLAAPLLLAGTACSSDTKEKAQDAAESAADDASETGSSLKDAAADKADEAAARAAAEDLRVRLKANDTANAEGVRSMAAIQESSKDVVGDPTFQGIEDSDGDGLDDDGKVQVDVGSASACVTLPAEGEDTQVEGGAC